MTRKVIYHSLFILGFSFFLALFFPTTYAKNGQYYHKQSKNLEKDKQKIEGFSLVLPWSLEVGLGYAHYKNMFKNDGNTALERIGIAKEWLRYKAIRAGLEVGVQSGNTGRLNVAQYQLDMQGGLPMEFTIKPTLDLLLTTRVYPFKKSSFFTLLKAGIIFRRLQFSRFTMNDLSKMNPEIQAGFGWNINSLASIFFAYQGIFGKRPNFQQINSQDLATTVGHISGIPDVNAVVTGLSIQLDSRMLR